MKRTSAMSRGLAILAAFALGISLAATSALAQQGQGQGQHQGQRQFRRGPPPQAVEACSDAEVGDTCSFTARNKTEVKGTCRKLGEDLVCMGRKAPAGGKAAQRQQQKKQQQQKQQQQQPLPQEQQAEPEAD